MATGQKMRQSSNTTPKRTRVTSTVIVPVATLKHVETGLYSIVLGINLRGKWELKTLPRTAISNIRNIPELANYGVDVDSENARLLMRWLSDMLRTNQGLIPETLLTNHFGFVNEGRDGFMRGREHISAHPGDPKVQFDPGVSGESGQTAGFRSSGTMEAWQKGADLLVPHSVPMLVVIASLAAPMLTVLNGQCQSFTVSLAGRTSTGKTVSLKCGCSVWGDPERLCLSWNNTQIGLERYLGLYGNLPLFLDDTKRAKTDDLIRDTIYMIQQERGMGRGKPGGLASTEFWHTLVVSSGESSLGSFFTDGGAHARYFEVQDMPFGDESAATAKSVNEVKGIFLANHGLAGPALIRALFEMKPNGGWERIRSRHLQLQREFAEHTKGGTGDRVAAYAAALQVTAETAVEVGILPDTYLKAVPKLWPQVARQATEAPVEERALVALLGWMQGHGEHFLGRNRKYNETDVEPTTGFVGAWDKKSDWKQVSFFRNALETILQELNFRHPDGVLRGWKDRRYLIANQDRLDHNTTFRGDQTRMVTIRRSAFDQVHGREADDGFNFEQVDDHFKINA
jgi:hypothetical protein